ncbi:MAG: flagellar motor protein MotB [Pseudomonadota bacterium]
MSDNEQSITIIKRKKVVGGDGHHGGAWKVAYADFVTAMMAFFMLMWLLNATTETQRKGLADYFSPTIAVARVSGGGDGAFGGDSLQSQSTLSQNGRGGFLSLTQTRVETEGDTGPANQETADETLAKVQAGLTGKGGESLVAQMALDHIITRVTEEGVLIEIFDLEEDPLFLPETAEPTEIMIAISEMLSDTLSLTSNRISVAGHSRAYSQVRLDNPAWDLTVERAHATRELFEADGLLPERVEKIIGYGQQKPIARNPMAFRNNRLEIVLLRDDV